MDEKKKLKIRNWGRLEKCANRRTLTPNFGVAMSAWICSMLAGIIILFVWMPLSWLFLPPFFISLREMWIHGARDQRDEIFRGPSARARNWAHKHTTMPFPMAVIGISIGTTLFILGLTVTWRDPALLSATIACLASGALVIPPYLRDIIIYTYRQKIEEIEAYLRGKAELELKEEV